MPQAGHPARDLIAAMLEPDFYPPRPSGVECIQTHISRVFLAGEFVYKIKKSICFPFVDYSTLERRFYFCREEVRLNRRLTPRVYLGVFPVYSRQGHFELAAQPASSFDSRAVEYAVKMLRLPDAQSLQTLAREGRIGASAMIRIARVLADFHAAAACERAMTYGSPEAIEKALGVNLEECEPFVGDTVKRRQFAALKRFNAGFIAAHRELIARRARDGRVREGHGDLRAEHIYVSPEHIDVVDCVEFSEGFRYADVASDLAFLLMDLDRLGAPIHGHQLLTAYLQASADQSLARMLNFYKCYRAVVRGKVSSIKARETEVPAAQRRAAQQTACEYFAAACGYAKAGSPVVIAVCGLPATGKSTIAQAFGQRSGFAVVNSDVVRKRLAGRAPSSRSGAPYGEGIYSPEFTVATYQALREEASKALRAGDGIIVDATFKNVGERQQLRDLARQMAVPVVFAECVIDDAQAKRRLAERGSHPDAVSDATWDVYQRHKAEYARFGPGFEACHLVVDGAAPPPQAAYEIERFIVNHC